MCLVLVATCGVICYIAGASEYSLLLSQAGIPGYSLSWVTFNECHLFTRDAQGSILGCALWAAQGCWNIGPQSAHPGAHGGGW